MSAPLRRATKNIASRRIVGWMRRVIIIGGGISSLSAAIAVRQVGLEVTVFERAEELKEVGAALALASNAIKALGRLGLANEVQRLGVPVKRHEIRSWRGQVLSELSLIELWKRIGAESVAMARASLQAVLLRALGKGEMWLGARCVGVEQSTSGVVARFADGREICGYVLIGADGINSVVRSFCWVSASPDTQGSQPGGVWPTSSTT